MQCDGITQNIIVRVTRLFSLLPLVTDALRAVVPRGAAEVYHAGHSAAHVTRLHRYDHSGIDVFMRREAAWHSGTDEGETAAESYLQLSTTQVDSLRHHQHAVLQHAASRLASGSASKASQIQSEKYKAHAAALARGGIKTTAKSLPPFVHEHSSFRNDVRAVTGLSSLSSQYVGPIGVGTRTQTNGEASSEAEVWVVFDTGSTNLWVASDECTEGPCAAKDRRRYNHTDSTTFSSTKHSTELTVQFGTGRLIGPTAVDNLKVGPFTVYNQTFAMIKREEGGVFEEVPFEGILGLAFPAMSAHGVKPFFDTVIEQKGLEHNEFAVYFSKDNPSANAVFWGGVDNRFFEGEIEYFPVTDPYYWAMDLHAFKIGDECLLGPGCESTSNGIFMETEAESHATTQTSGWFNSHPPYAIVDTGTTYFTAESDLFFDIIHRLPPGNCKDVTNETHLPITYILKNAAGREKEFTLTQEMYMTRRGNGDDAHCSPAFMKIDVPQKHGPAMLFGEVFLRYFYAVFDRGDGSDAAARIGFAPAVHSNSINSDLKELTNSQPTFQETRNARL